jgi:hypothetical protein
VKRVAVIQIAGMIAHIKESFDASCGTGNSLEASPGSATGVTSGNQAIAPRLRSSSVAAEVAE